MRTIDCKIQSIGRMRICEQFQVEPFKTNNRTCFLKFIGKRVPRGARLEKDTVPEVEEERYGTKFPEAALVARPWSTLFSFFLRSGGAVPCLQRKVVTATCWAHLCSMGSIIKSFKSGATSSWYPLPATALTALRQVATRALPLRHQNVGNKC